MDRLIIFQKNNNNNNHHHHHQLYKFHNDMFSILFLSVSYNILIIRTCKQITGSFQVTKLAAYKTRTYIKKNVLFTIFN
jgi:hypothetical protein